MPKGPSGGLEVGGLREAMRGCDATMKVVDDAALEELMIVCLYEMRLRDDGSRCVLRICILC
jgi:hypothetical protein